MLGDCHHRITHSTHFELVKIILIQSKIFGIKRKYMVILPFLIPIFIILLALVTEVFLTSVFSFGAPKGWNRQLVFQDNFFLFIAIAASEMAYKNYSHNPDPIDVMWILGVIYLVVYRMLKWKIL